MCGTHFSKATDSVSALSHAEGADGDLPLSRAITVAIEQDFAAPKGFDRDAARIGCGQTRRMIYAKFRDSIDFEPRNLVATHAGAGSDDRKCYRDIHAGAAHVLNSEQALIDAGAVLVGTEGAETPLTREGYSL